MPLTYAETSAVSTPRDAAPAAPLPPPPAAPASSGAPTSTARGASYDKPRTAVWPLVTIAAASAVLYGFATRKGAA